MKQYKVRRILSREDFLSKLDTFEKLHINLAPWGADYRPESYAVCGHDGEFIHVYMKSFDPFIRATVKEDNGDIYCDSCMEFFFNPIHDGRDFFINFEINPFGYMFAAYGNSDRIKNTRTCFTTEKYNHLGLETKEQVPEDGVWDFCISVPFQLVSDIVPEFRYHDQMTWGANFYKCGDFTKIPHYLTWSPIEPDGKEENFYRVDCFGLLQFE